MSTIQQLTDRLDISELIARLGRWLDGRGGDPATIYDRDVVVRSPRGEFEGYDAVMAYITREDPSGERFQHFHSDIEIALDGDRAAVEANQLTQFFLPDTEPHRTAGLRLHYQVVRRAGGWRIASAHIELVWMIGAPIAA